MGETVRTSVQSTVLFTEASGNQRPTELLPFKKAR